ncbi:MAG: phosphoribosyltransferase family protein [Ilumatobacteraceae bacterium]
MSSEREIMSWEIFGTASRELAQQVADDYEPDMILSIARGGLLIGGALGYALSVKNVYTMNVEFYTGVDERLEVPRILPPAPDFVDASHFKILIADDVADTGHTLRSVPTSAPARWPRRTACLYEKSHSVVKCDYVWKKTDLWINFPGATRTRSRSAAGRQGRPDLAFEARCAAGAHRAHEPLAFVSGMRSRCVRLTAGQVAERSRASRRRLGTTPSRRPSRHTVTTGAAGSRRDSTSDRSSSRSALATRDVGTISWVSAT